MPLRPVLLLCLLAGASAAEGPADHEAALRALIGQAADAINRNESGALQGLLAQPFRLVLADQQAVQDRRGLDGLFAAWIGPKAPLRSCILQPTVESLHFPAEGLAIVGGSSRDLARLGSGEELAFTARWTATCVRDGGAWRLSTLHAGIDPLDNPLLDLTRSRAAEGIHTALTWGPFIGLLVGAVVGLLVGLRLRKAPAGLPKAPRPAR